MSEQSFQIVGHKIRQDQQLTQNNKIFAFQNGNIQYTNFEQTKFQEQKKSLQIIVHNYLCYQQTDKLIKITQIMYEDKILRIKDQLKISNHLQNKKQQIKRSIVKFGRNNYSDPRKQQKSDVKNLIKKIINIFINWLCQKNTEESKKTNRKVKKIIKKMKYFNKILIQQLSKDKDICLCFIQFNQTDSQALIENSRIRDKQCHHKAIKNYTQIFIDSNCKLNQAK